MDDSSSRLPCTVRDTTVCDGCTLDKKLHCRWDKGVLNGFMAISIPVALGTILLLVVLFVYTSQWWPIAAYIILIVVIFQIEIGFLCSHCPFYEFEGKTLHCLGNNGAPKLFSYHPGPLSGTERWATRLLILFYCFIFPLIAGLAAILAIPSGSSYSAFLTVTVCLLIMTLVASVVFLVIMKIYYCSMCVNFSCPLNTVTKENIDIYLGKNEVMRNAWTARGYIPGPDEKKFD